MNGNAFIPPPPLYTLQLHSVHSVASLCAIYSDSTSSRRCKLEWIVANCTHSFHYLVHCFNTFLLSLSPFSHSSWVYFRLTKLCFCMCSLWTLIWYYYTSPTWIPSMCVWYSLILLCSLCCPIRIPVCMSVGEFRECLPRSQNRKYINLCIYAREPDPESRESKRAISYEIYRNQMESPN